MKHQRKIWVSVSRQREKRSLFLKQATISAFFPFNLLKLLHFLIIISTTFVLCLTNLPSLIDNMPPQN